MRVLPFLVKGQQVVQKPGSDFSGLVRGSVGYLHAKFEFDSDWDRCVRIASFFDAKGNETAMQLKNDECEIPAEALKDHVFYVSVIGKKCDYKITTNKCPVRQGG